MSYATYPAPSGNTNGPASSVDNGIAQFDGTSGKLLKDLGVGSANQVLLTDGTAPSFGLIANANVDASAAIAYSKLALTDSIVNADINSSAAIAYSKLNLTTSIVNGDINASAAIDFSKLATLGSGQMLVGSSGGVPTARVIGGDISISDLGQVQITGGVIIDNDINASAGIAFSKLAALTSGNILVGSAGNVATSVAVTGDVTISNTGVTAISSGVIVNDDVNASAAIALTKLAATTANRALASDASGFIVASTVTDTELGYLSGVTSGIQGQIDGKAGIADNETITGTWTFNNTITGDISGNAGTVTNGAYVNASNTFTLAQTISAASNQLVLSSSTNQLTLNSGTSAAARTYTVPDVGTTADFVMTAGTQTIGGAKTFSDEISTDAAHRGGYGLLPVGAIVAYNPGYYTTGNNGSFTISGPAGNSVAQVNTYLNGKGWYVCDGAEVNVAASPIWNAAGRHLPNLDDGRFLRGSTTAGTQGGSATASIAHTHSVTSNVTVGNHNLTVANLPPHSHDMTHIHSIAHNHASFNTASGGAHIHSHIAGVDGLATSGGGPANRWVLAGGAVAANLTTAIYSNNSNHTHTIDVPNYTGNSGVARNEANTADKDNTGDTGSGTAVTHSVTNNPVTSGGASVSSISIEPQYLNTFFIVRVF